MRAMNIKTYAPAMLAATVIIAGGCSSDASRLTPTAPGELASRLQRAAPAATADVFVRVFWGSDVVGYARTGGPPVETLSGLADPRGLAFDANGNLYVADRYSQDIEVYAPGSTSPFRSLAEPSGDQPYLVAVDGQNHLWVGNDTAGSADIVEFTTTGSLLQTLFCKGLKDLSSGAIAADSAGNVFIQAINVHRAVVVEEIPAGKTTCAALPPKPAYPGGLTLTSAGSLVVGDNQNYDAFTYAAPSFKRIVERTNFGGGNPSGASDPAAIALTKDNTQIWTADYPGNSTGASITLFPYPHGSRKPLVSIDLSVSGALYLAVDY
jgi:hypothetical protein